VNWTSNYPSSPAFDSQIAATWSASGKTLLALSGSGTVSRSFDAGATWTHLLALQTQLQDGALACSADGITLAVAACAIRSPTIAFVSTNSGAMWSQTQLGGTNFISVVSSADGSKLAVALFNAGTYAWQGTPSPALRMASSLSDLFLSWTVPSMNFVLQQSPTIMPGQWESAGVIPTLDYTNLQYRVSVSRTEPGLFYRLKAQ
jgi:hypothetical protein